MKRLLFLIAVLSFATSAEAYPEFVRHGYFSCTSCHVSPAGGSTLTDYGRSFAAEKLTTWTGKDEERVGHGKLPQLPEWLILGGNFRQAQTIVESSRSRDGRWIPMQRDVDACLKVSITWSCATVGLLAKADPGDEARFGLRKAALRIDAGENFVVRAGRFFPRYGLMIANHTSPVRRGLGFDQNKEADQLEVTYVSEFIEATIYREFGRKIHFDGDTTENTESFDPAFGLTASALLGTTSRAGVSYRQVQHEETTDQIAGGFAAIGWSPRTFTLVEVDQRATVIKHPTAEQPKILRGAVSHLKFAHEPIQGLVPYLLHEADVPDITAQTTRKDTYGMGLQWFPRPHLELDTFYGHLLMRQDYSYAAVAYFILHYYL